jgi:hypothetical protein
LLVVVFKGTFVLPKAGEPVRLHDEQLPLIMADTFTGEPGLSAPVHEVDFAPRKHACDVLLTGHARAPTGRQVTRLRAGLRVGSMEKVFDVVGDRVWQAGLKGVTASAPLPFGEKLVSYDTAFGGADRNSQDESEHDAYLPNPVGRGWHKHLKNVWVDGKPLPNTEELGKAVSFPGNKYKPMSLGPLGRGWPQRARYAGTYDQPWLDDVFPFLPKDFDERYYQAAPADQQHDYLVGGEEVALFNLTPEGRTQFVLPTMQIPVTFYPADGDEERVLSVCDTLLIEPDAGRFTMTWRASRRLSRNVFELPEAVVGQPTRAWERARMFGKTYYRSLGELRRPAASQEDED